MISERFVLTARRELLDHLLIFSARHLEAVIKEFLVHYHHARPHKSLEQLCPAPIMPAPNLVPAEGRICPPGTASEGYSTVTPGPPDRVDGGMVTP